METKQGPHMCGVIDSQPQHFDIRVAGLAERVPLKGNCLGTVLAFFLISRIAHSVLSLCPHRFAKRFQPFSERVTISLRYLPNAQRFWKARIEQFNA